MLQPHHDANNFAQVMHSVFSPVKWVWWRVVEQMFKLQFRLPKEMIPDTPIEVDVFSGGQILNYEFRDMLKAGKVNAKKGSLQRMTPKGAVLQDGTEVEADILVFGTGFGKSYDVLESSLRERLDLERDGLYLHRNVLPPNVPGLAFVGAEVSTFNNILTHGLQAEWLARVMQGSVDLTPEKMSQAVEREQAWKRSWMPATSARASILQLHMMKYHDMLLRDMGENHKRKGWNVLAEVFAPYNARDYSAVFQHDEEQVANTEMQLGTATA